MRLAWSVWGNWNHLSKTKGTKRDSHEKHVAPFSLAQQKDMFTLPWLKDHRKNRTTEHCLLWRFMDSWLIITLLGRLRGGLRGARTRGRVGFARLRGKTVASQSGFAGLRATNISDVCALMQLNHVQSMRKGAMKAVRETLSFKTRGHGWASKGAEHESWTAVASRRLCGGFAEASRRRSIVASKTGPETHSALPVVFLVAF